MKRPRAIFSPFDSRAQHAGVASTLRALLAIAPPVCSVGFPQPLGARRGAIAGAATLTFAADSGSEGLRLALPQAVVRALSERLLGGEGQIATHAAGGAALPAELGAVAYLTARVGAVLGDAQLVDVHASGDDLHALPDAHVAWPIVLRSELGPLPVTLIAAPALWTGQTFRSELIIAEGGAPTEPLAVGDLLVLELSPTLLSDGPSGDALVRVAELDAELVVALAGGRVTSRLARPAGTPPAEVVLGARALSLAELLALHAGLAWSPSARAAVRLEGVERARGALVRLRGALALRVDELA